MCSTRTSLIHCWNAAGALHSANGMTKYMYVPNFVETVVFHSVTILFSGLYLQQVTNSLLTITSLSPVAVAIAKSVDSYLATSIARLICDRRVLVPASVMDKGLCIDSIVYGRT